MGLRAWLADPFGVREHARANQEILAAMIETTRQQTEAARSMVAIMERVYSAAQHDGFPPEGRHLTEEAEAELFEEMDRRRGND